MTEEEYSQQIPASDLLIIYRDWFQQHMLTYNLLKKLETVTIHNVSFDQASIIYSIRLFSDKEKRDIEAILKNDRVKINIYGNDYTPHIYMNGDLLCITINKKPRKNKK